ncbi:MAG: 30S ribosomal protein S16 [Alphaproteobacteria bacterium]
MPTTIRLSRQGAKKRPYYHFVVTDSRNPRDSKFIEKIGTYNPLLEGDNENRVKIDSDRAKHWLSHGATMSDRVHLFFNNAGIVQTKPAQRAARKPKKEQPETAAQAPATEAPAETPKTEETSAE